MATPVTNRLHGHAWFNFSGNTTIALSDLSSNSSLETVSEASISKIIFTGPWQIYRGANLVWQTSNTSFTHDFAALGTSLNTDSTATIVCNTASSNASIMICVSKMSTANGGATV